VSAKPTEGRWELSLMARARQLRKQMTREEVKLWLQLKQINARSSDFRGMPPTPPALRATSPRGEDKCPNHDPCH